MSGLQKRHSDKPRHQPLSCFVPMPSGPRFGTWNVASDWQSRFYANYTEASAPMPQCVCVCITTKGRRYPVSLLPGLRAQAALPTRAAAACEARVRPLQHVHSGVRCGLRAAHSHLRGMIGGWVGLKPSLWQHKHKHSVVGQEETRKEGRRRRGCHDR